MSIFHLESFNQLRQLSRFKKKHLVLSTKLLALGLKPYGFVIGIGLGLIFFNITDVKEHVWSALFLAFSSFLLLMYQFFKLIDAFSDFKQNQKHLRECERKTLELFQNRQHQYEMINQLEEFVPQECDLYQKMNMLKAAFIQNHPPATLRALYRFTQAFETFFNDWEQDNQGKDNLIERFNEQRLAYGKMQTEQQRVALDEMSLSTRYFKDYL